MSTASMNSQDLFAATEIDRVSLPQGSLDIVKRVRTNPLPWKGQFSPQLVEQLLDAYADRAEVVLDPFAGSGTSLGESSRIGIAAIGCDVNPAAVVLAKVYQFANSPVIERKAALDEFRALIDGIVARFYVQDFSGRYCGTTEREKLEAALVDLCQESTSDQVCDLAAALVVLCDFHRSVLDMETVLKTWRRLHATVSALPYSTKPIVVHQADARALPIESTSVDLVLTSPPYINVHNYHQKYRRSVEALGWRVLPIARSEIGSNRQNRANRFLTVIQYSLDMALALREMVRVAKSGSRLILVLGRESKVRGCRFLNGELVTELAVNALNLEFERRQERVFRNRFGTDIFEDILHFRVRHEIPDEGLMLDQSRQIAGQTLSLQSSVSTDKARQGIDDALSRLENVTPSPIHTS